MDQFSVFLNSKNFNIDIKIIEDGEHILYTGGGIQNMIKESHEKDFIIFNPDTIWNNDYKDEILKMEKIYFSEKLENILLLVNKKFSFDKKLKGDFNLKNNLINKEAEKEFIYIGCQIINKKLFIKEQIENFSILEIWKNLLGQKKLFGYESQKDFYHLTDLGVSKLQNMVTKLFHLNVVLEIDCLEQKIRMEIDILKYGTSFLCNLSKLQKKKELIYQNHLLTQVWDLKE